MAINELSEEDFELLRESATRFFAEQMPVAAIREIRDQPHPQGFDTDLWQGMVGMGWSGILVSEDHGGLGMGHRSMGVIMEAAGHNLAVCGEQGLGWSGEVYDEGRVSRDWLRSKGNSIEGGTSEIQLNVVAKRVLGLPD